MLSPLERLRAFGTNVRFFIIVMAVEVCWYFKLKVERWRR